MQTQLRDVEYFAAIAEHGQVQRAAEALGLSQPALSKSLRRLEQAMNAKLFLRTPKGVELTSAGTALLARASRLRLTMDDVTREIADLSEGRAGNLRIGMAPRLIYLVPKACTALLKEAPRLNLKITHGELTAMMARLRNGTLDIVVTPFTIPNWEDLVEEHLYDEEFAIYASANHRLAKRKRLTLAELAQEQWTLHSRVSPIAQSLTREFGALGLPPPKIAMETQFMMARFYLVATSDLLTFGSKLVAQYAAGHLGIKELRLKGLSNSRPVGVRFRKDAYLPPAALRFIEVLKKVTRELGKSVR